jgi:acyl-CoA synthetase
VTARHRAEYQAAGWWTSESVSDLVHGHATARPEATAYRDDHGVLPWHRYDAHASSLARVLAGLGVAPGTRAAVLVGDGAAFHVALLGCERAGLISVGLPARGNDGEHAELMGRVGSTVLVTSESVRGRPPAEVVVALEESGARVEHHVVLGAQGDPVLVSSRDGDGRREDAGAPGSLEGRQVPPTDLWLLNFTSGTTGLPKVVTQTQNRWLYQARMAIRSAEITHQDVVLSAIPGGYGFGLWSGHMLPAVLGLTCVQMERFTPEAALALIESERVTVLACVTTQLVMMLESDALAVTDTGSLRSVFTGGEMVHASQARRWEARTGSRVLQFYGSNEGGPVSGTTLADDDETRLSTTGRILPGTDFRLLEETRDEHGRRCGQLAVRGPGAHGSYWADDAANRDLLTDDGFVVMADLVSVDESDRLRVVGRQSDIIIRGGRNISAAVVEGHVLSHPAVRMAAAVPVPDAVFGERIGVAVELNDEVGDLGLTDLVGYLTARGIGKEYLPEKLVVVDSMPVSSGAKADKKLIRGLLAR